MKRVWLTAFAALLIAGSSFAEDGVKAVFLPGTSSEPAKVVFTDTNMVASVIGAMNGQAPADCPDGSFWTKSEDSLVSCKDGVTFKLSPLEPSDRYYNLFAGRDASKLQKIKGIGTDDPGPMRDDSKKAQKP
ncbi:MAG: hypothetical protein EOQ64_15210 [Mesorhizobium sp.]|uniref:hypothetical protein n=1 Tax=Mesorhizobium sp. TaxID=1871066 RepID=UPI000FE8D393|nr:hypothetical protein [Mesorhizobium sp.]RWG55920.1 MAG: hypothetical protein EOQ64_15210 [Mesorhizobium sp.]RWH40573.1 MAG: hypothetical protein EOQ78_20855 [Mesorhizobium sp.]RWI19481.1 MAG: hypothetical protein EOQ94_21060 [Mesorhizobium sp.]